MTHTHLKSAKKKKKIKINHIKCFAFLSSFTSNNYTYNIIYNNTSKMFRFIFNSQNHERFYEFY